MPVDSHDSICVVSDCSRRIKTYQITTDSSSSTARIGNGSGNRAYQLSLCSPRRRRQRCCMASHSGWWRPVTCCHGLQPAYPAAHSCCCNREPRHQHHSGWWWWCSAAVICFYHDNNIFYFYRITQNYQWLAYIVPLHYSHLYSLKIKKNINLWLIQNIHCYIRFGCIIVYLLNYNT